MTKKREYYINLLTYSYDDLVDFLLKKHGEAKFDYFYEENYDRILNNEIKKRKYVPKLARTKEGLWCHHIDEKKYLNLASEDFLKLQKPPFSVQKKERLVYCDLFEHAILHFLIAKETQGQFGAPGLEVYLKPQIRNWYIDGNEPQIDWKKKCYERAYLDSESAQEILELMTI